LPRPNQQSRIVEILSTLDETIEQTEALIAKMQQVKAGLMHDLFIRGVTSDRCLRPTREQAPDLYKESPLGWIPKEWETSPIASIAESLVDGPFGSNLKSEHYVVEPGVRVVRLQNIQEGYYDDSDPVFVSQHHADYLSRNAVNSGDVLIAALGDENYPVGRSCCYPVDLPPAINKADCFRLRCLSDIAINTYMMHFLNTATARTQIKRYEQGVTRRRTNLGNLRRIIVVLPDIDEQRRIIERLASVSTQVEAGELQVEKLHQQKLGLMNDLLTGRVYVKEAC
jgi:type I restriction enzyme S subunit